MIPQVHQRREDVVAQPGLAGVDQVAVLVEDPDLDPRPRETDAAGMVPPLLRRDPGRPTLAGPVQLVDLGMGKRFHHLRLDHDRAGGGGVDDQRQAGDVQRLPLLIRELEDADEVGRHHERPGPPASADLGQPRTGR